MRELFADDNQIYVVMAAGQGIPQKETEWESWLEIINLKIADSLQHSDAQKIWYTGKTMQAEALEKKSTDEVHLVDTSLYPVTGQNIRNDALRYFNAIALPFRRAFTKKVLVLGAPSGGKTTLVKDLAKLYSCPYSFEYSRQYQEESNVNDFELDGMDYQRLVTGQFQLNRDTIADPASQGMAILDTDVMVTKVYARLGAEDVDYAITPEEYAIVEQSANAFIARQLWDLILVVPPTLKYVDDGYRNMKFSEDAFLTTIHEMMLEEIESSRNLDKVVMLDAKGIGEKDEFSYYARYKQAKEAIDELMGHKQYNSDN